MIKRVRSPFIASSLEFSLIPKLSINAGEEEPCIKSSHMRQILHTFV